MAPRWARALLRVVVPPTRLDDVVGDLDEVHARRTARHGGFAAWFGTSFDALHVAGAFVIYRWRDRGKNPLRWITWPEVKLGLRLMKRQPFMTATIVIALGTGVGLATTGFTFIDAVLHGELPFEDGNRYVRFSAQTDPDGRSVNLDLDHYHLLRERATTFATIGAIQGGDLNIRHQSGSVETVRGAYLTTEWFRFLPLQPVAGRLLIPRDGDTGAVPVMLIRESLSNRHFARPSEAIGSIVNVAGIERTVVGVVPDAFEFPLSGEIWAPLDARYLDGDPSTRNPAVGVFGIMAPDVSLETAQAQVEQLSSQYTAAQPGAESVRVRLTPYTEIVQSLGIETMLAVFMTILILVLVVVASNVANLILARASSRSSELAVRTALGASRGRLVSQLFVEVLLLGTVAAVLGISASQAVLRMIGGSIEELPFWIDFSPSVSTIAFVTLATLLTSAIAGALPALKATRRDHASGLRAGGRGGVTHGFGRIGAIMIVAEMALSVALLSVAVMMARGFVRYAGQDIAIVPPGTILTAQIYIEPPPRADDETAEAERRRADSVSMIRQRLLDAVEEMPGVATFGVSTSLPRLSPPVRPAVLDGIEVSADAAPMMAAVAGVRTGFLETLGGRATAGRLFNDADFDPGAPLIAVVNEPFVQSFLGGRNPIGQRVRVVEPDDESRQPEWREIVGVVPDLGLSVGDAELAAGYYVPMTDEPLFYLALRAHGDPLRLANPLREAMFGVDPNIIVQRIVPLEAVGLEDRAMMATLGSGLSAIAGVALLLSLVGMYAIMSFTVTRRTREIGIRVALGAQHQRILRSVVGRTGLLLVIGTIAGSALGIVIVQARGIIFASRLPDAGPWILPAIAVLMAASGLVACWVPAQRALRIRPVEALTAE